MIFSKFLCHTFLAITRKIDWLSFPSTYFPLADLRYERPQEDGDWETEDGED